MCIVEEFPVSIVEENPPCAGADPALVVAQAAALPVRRPLQQYSPQWVRVFAAMEDLRHTLDVNQLLATHPAVAQDFVAVLGALEALRGDKLFESYWRAQLERMANQNPKAKDPQPAAISLARGSVYIHQASTPPGKQLR
jgi:hypothetical protein